ncbi:dTMP kinase [Legionella maceachernii]|uniref:Thymidylate kinase n=1 Tax=Legionella maceachernii TaxID=466 RepID=A0A0W0WB76_9GAMM|nr:dTMP kinase [Legionella maceachernii]KTD29621.1 thymidylate kinase [Legionella maceachernii]SKA20445.1 dTMP kinase [Legionella maceachernii]SUP02708.1 Thymidylate kinase [Legionella maceachernii]
MTQRGRFIVVEGLEGAGKSTAIETIQQCLQHAVPDLVMTREPGGTRIGEAVRHLIKEKVDGETLDPRSELLLLYAARVQLVEQIIRPALENGCWVLADRFELSTFAYQGGGRGLDQDMIHSLSSFCLRGFKPDLVFYLDIDPEQGLRRVKTRGAFDRIEQESLTFFTQIRKSYLQLIKSMDNVILIEASQPLETVQESIRTQLNVFLNNAIDKKI